MQLNFVNEKSGKKIPPEENCQVSYFLLNQKEKNKSTAFLN